MSSVLQILVSARARRRLAAVALLAVLAACGQKGPLFLPKGEAAAGRASLPETLSPNSPAGTAVSPAGGASAPEPKP
jgi:predicted small lipoprotein YifL